MITHELKSWSGDSRNGYGYQPIADGTKRFDIRTDDRRPRFAVGQLVKFNEHEINGPTGRSVVKKITFVQPGATPGCVAPLHGLKMGYVCLGLGDPDDAK